jgi:hypothetical protein
VPLVAHHRNSPSVVFIPCGFGLIFPAGVTPNPRLSQGLRQSLPLGQKLRYFTQNPRPGEGNPRKWAETWGLSSPLTEHFPDPGLTYCYSGQDALSGELLDLHTDLTLLSLIAKRLFFYSWLRYSSPLPPLLPLFPTCALLNTPPAHLV